MKRMTQLMGNTHKFGQAFFSGKYFPYAAPKTPYTNCLRCKKLPAFEDIAHRLTGINQRNKLPHENQETVTVLFLDLWRVISEDFPGKPDYAAYESCYTHNLKIACEQMEHSVPAGEILFLEQVKAIDALMCTIPKDRINPAHANTMRELCEKILEMFSAHLQYAP